MYIVRPSELPEPDRTAEAVGIMAETLKDVSKIKHLSGISFVGEVYLDTDTPDLYNVALYCGRVTSMLGEPPTFNLLVDEAFLQTGPCDCPGGDVDMIFTDFEQAMEEAQIAQDCEDFAGVSTQDPHYEVIPLEPNTEITIRFDRLGAYGAHGIIGN